MNILEILRKELVGKHISLEKYNYKHPKAEHIQPRYFLPGHAVNRIINEDRYFTLVGQSKFLIEAIDGESDMYEGDSLYIRIVDEGVQHELCITILDQLIIT